MKDLLKIVFMVGLVIVVYLFRGNISNFILNNVIHGGSNSVLTYNEYYLDYDYLYVQNAESNSVKSYQEALNMFYSIINSGDDSYSFHCDYETCINDVKNLIYNTNIIANINNFVHPYNSFETININIMSNNNINVIVNKVYTEKQISYINDYIVDFINNNISDTMEDYDKIKLFHNYIINNTIYDEDKNSASHTAYTLIKTGKAICGGYSDIMSIYLNYLGIQNYKITSENHIWNLIKLNDKWYHLDATWDDPVTSDGKQYLLHNFFMITTEELQNLDKFEHNYDKKIYMEAN